MVADNGTAQNGSWGSWLDLKRPIKSFKVPPFLLFLINDPSPVMVANRARPMPPSLVARAQHEARSVVVLSNGMDFPYREDYFTVLAYRS